MLNSDVITLGNHKIDYVFTHLLSITRKITKRKNLEKVFVKYL